MECLERFQGTWLLQESVTRAMDKLECLHDELDFANSTATKLDVMLQLVRAHNVALDPPLDARDFVEKIRCWATRVNKGLVLSQKFVSQFAAATDAARFD